MSLSLVSSFPTQVNLVLPLASNNNGLAVRVASLGSSTLGTLTVSGLQGTATWTLSAATPAWVTSVINSAGTICTLSFTGAQYQVEPYEFFVSCTDGVNPAVYFPIFLEVRAPFSIAPASGTTTLNIPSYDSTVGDIQILGYGSGGSQQINGCNFILPPSLPAGLNFVTSNESKLVLRVSEPHFGNAPLEATDLVGGLQLYTSSPTTLPLTLYAYQPGSFYDEPDRAYQLNLSVSSQTQKAGTLNFGLGAYFDTTSKLLEVDAKIDVLLGILQSSGTPVATPLKYYWTNDSSLALSGGGGTLTSTSATYTISSATTTGYVSLQIQDANGLPVANGLKTINFNALGPSGGGSWLGTNAIKVGVAAPVGSTPSKVTGYLGQTLTLTLSSPDTFNSGETIYFTLTTEKESSIESALPNPVVTNTGLSIGTGASATTTVSFQFPAGAAIGNKWVLKIAASNDISAPTRQGYTQVLFECTGKSPIVVGGVPSTLNTSTGTNIPPIQLTATDPSTGFAVVSATFELVGGSEFGDGVHPVNGAPDGLYINSSNQIAGNALTPGTYKFVVAASVAGYQRSYSAVVTMTVTSVATQLVITNPTSSVNSVQDNTTFTLSWGVSGTPTALYLAQAPPDPPLISTVTGDSSLVMQQVGSSVYGMYGTSYYGTSYSVPLVVISSSIATATNLLPSPTTAVINENHELIVNWQPYTVNGAYTAYSGWNVNLQTPPGIDTPITIFTDGLENGGTLSARVFEEQLTAGDYSINMTALSANGSIALNSNPWDSSHTFPPSLQAANVTFDNVNLLLGQTLTITLNANYGGAGTWQILFPDNTSTGWLPLSTRSIAKSFSTPGALDIIVQTKNDFKTANPPVTLLRQFTQQIYVVDQQYTSGTTTQGDLTGTLGIGGNSLFEIVNASIDLVTPQPYEVVVRSVARDTVTNELKLMIATSRFSNASSLLNTMAIDVFPMVGRPHSKELIEPIYILEKNSATSLVPVTITTGASGTTLPSNSYVGKPMQEFKMQATGGTPEYSWYATGLPPGLKMNVDGTISGTPSALGAYTVNFACMDSSAYIAETTLTFTIPTDLKIVATLPLPNAVVGTPYPGILGQIANTGGLAPYTWAVVAGQLPIGMSFDPNLGVLGGVPCTYTSEFPNSNYTETYNFVIQVTDAINAKASQSFSINLAPAPLSLGTVDQFNITASEQYKLVVPIYGGQPPYTYSAPIDSGVINSDSGPINGQIEFLASPTTAAVGALTSFKATIGDSSTPQRFVTTVGNSNSQYRVREPVSAVYVADAFFDNYWGTGDTTSITHSVVGNLAGFSIQSSTTTLSDGLTLAVNGAAKTVTVSGPPTSFLNSQIPIQLPILQGSNQVSAITREYTLLSHSGTTNVGTVQCFTHPYIVGSFVALNPLKPWFNSPSITPIPVATNITGNLTIGGYTARVQTGSSLPPGLSFDSNTTLIYGTLSGVALTHSIIEYIDTNSVIQGTVTIVWDTQNSAFPLTDNLVDGQVQTPIIADTSTISSSSITACGVYKGHLPAGLSLQVDPSGTFVSIVGTPTEAGYFDVWFRLTNSNGQAAFLYHRLFIDYINPLVILTSSLPVAVIGESYSFQLQGFGGIPFSPPAQPYTWSLASTPAGMSFNTGTGVLSGIPTGGASTTSLTFTVTDSRGVVNSRTLLFTIINTVTIQTTVLPTIQVGIPYSFTITAVGGTLPYNWTCPQLSLDGISLNSTTGVLSGTTSVVISPTSIFVTVSDAGTPIGSSTRTFTLQTGAQGGMYIDSSGVVPIDRGAPYQGVLKALGTVAGVPNLPVSWRVDSSSPNPLPAGFTLQANSADQGATAIISGSTTASLADYIVIVSATDSIGNPASVTLSLDTTSSLAITTTSLPQGITAVPYNGGTPYLLTASGYNTPFTWSVVSSTPSSFPYTLNSSTGAISGTSNAAFNGNVTFRVIDNLSPADTAQATLGLVISASTLQITTTSLPQGTAGITYNVPLTASGGITPYTWSVSPSSANLPSGLNLVAGAISGITTQVGTTIVTIRVTDSIGSYVDKALSLTVISGLGLYTGIDYTDSLSTNYLGYIDTGSVASINPHPNYPFYVVATGVITTSAAALQSGIAVNPGFTATVTSLSGGIAYIALSGPFSSGVSGDNPFGITVTDSGVSATGAFKWWVYNSGTLRVTATNSFPTQLTRI